MAEKKEKPDKTMYLKRRMPTENEWH